MAERKLLFGAAGVAVLLIIVAFAYWASTMRSGVAANTQALNEALLQSQTAAQTSPPATSNPVKQATPAVNPVEAANPFNGTTSTASKNNDYQNPFQ